MSQIPKEYLPPEDHLPEKIYPLPEVRLPRRINLGHLFLDRHIEEGRGEAVAIIHDDRKITFSEFQSEVNRLANVLKHFGMGKDDRVMLRSPNRPEFVAGCFACWKIGAIPVLVNHLLKKDEISFRANDSGARAALVSSDTFAELDEAMKDSPLVEQVIVFGDRIAGQLYYNDMLAGQSDRIGTVETTTDDWMRIIYSSGTTGKAKGIVSSIGDMVAGITVANQYLLKLSPEEVLGSLPAFTFAFGFFSILFFGHTGCALLIFDRFDAENVYGSIENYGVNVLRCVPTGFRMLLEVKDAEDRYDLRSLRLCQSAGEMLPGIVAAQWKERFGSTILNSLGSADLNSYLSTRVDMPRKKLDSSGIPLPGVECKIVDEHFKALPRGSLGELVIKAPWGQHYWRRPDVQTKSVTNGWNRTGLLFVEDQDGYYWFNGRDDDMIVSSGYKIPAGEVETALMSHETVSEAAVIPSPHPIRGNIVKAFVVLREGSEGSDRLAEELKTFVKSRIEPYKYPREIEFTDSDSLPRTVTGKIQRFILREKERKKTIKPLPQGRGFIAGSNRTVL
jgi:2-aminobenzoate-CoA ligase